MVHIKWMCVVYDLLCNKKNFIKFHYVLMKSKIVHFLWYLQWLSFWIIFSISHIVKLFQKLITIFFLFTGKSIAHSSFTRTRPSIPSRIKSGDVNIFTFRPILIWKYIIAFIKVHENNLARFNNEPRQNSIRVWYFGPSRPPVRFNNVSRNPKHSPKLAGIN